MSQPRGAQSGLSLRTLLIASAASAAAAVVVHQIWRPGVLIGAAVTPLIIAIVQDLLNRPAQRLEALRAERPTAQWRRAEPEPERAPTPVGEADPVQDELTPVHVYGRPREPRRGLRLALLTGLIAFVIGALALSLSELVFGGSVAGGTRTTYFGGDDPTPTPTPTPTATPDGEATPAPTETPEATEEATPTPEATETPEETATPTPTATPSPAPTPTPAPAP